MNLGFDPSTIALALGGALGAFAHAVFSKDYRWRSKQTASDVLVGLGLGILIPVLPLPALLGMIGVDFQLPVAVSTLTPAQKGAGMFFVGYALIDVIRDKLLNRFQPPPTDRRVSDPKPPPQEASK